jgi:hypothetical protein
MEKRASELDRAKGLIQSGKDRVQGWLAEPALSYAQSKPFDSRWQWATNPQSMSETAPEGVLQPAWNQFRTRFADAPWHQRMGYALAPNTAADLIRRRFTDSDARPDMGKFMGEVGGGLLQGLKFMGAGLGRGAQQVYNRAQPYISQGWQRFLPQGQVAPTTHPDATNPAAITPPTV